LALWRVAPAVSLGYKAAMPDFAHELRILARVEGLVAGVDEAGRGPLAGPVVAAAVIFEKKRIPRGLNDSKKLSAAAREKLFDKIMQYAVAVGVGEASVDEIDLVNIRQATHLAMARAVRALSPAPVFALVDGNDPPPLPCPCETIVKGDGISASIAAASIIAKVTRDRLMLKLHEQHPEYHWDWNKGYGTEDHLHALAVHGATPHHRRSFAPIHNILYGGNLEDSIISP
jgi:ribonuclease HII